MKVIFGGVRGSGPVTGLEFSAFGGDTTSVLVQGDQGERVVIDAGTGVRHFQSRLGELTDPLVLLLTHYHLDHLLGLPAFLPLYQKGRPLTVVGPVSDRGRPNTREILSTFMGEPFWPIPLTEAGADLSTLDVGLLEGSWLDEPGRDFLPVGKLEIRACPLVHPGGCLAWRIDEPVSGSSLAIATDVEWGRASDTERNLFLDFCRTPRPVSLLVMDGHFNAAEYGDHRGWGHSTWEEVAEVGQTVRAEQIAVTHHAPGNNDRSLAERDRLLQKRLSDRGHQAKAFFARQGQELPLPGSDG